ncbi:telomeric repeat-binding factor 1 isoform X2 [Heterodontus francisci]|uniref:telomeric repeat-binding factor 1 isoform X2 n=1 Tax=Heterodontus francisci TaxID=7792 RepID=UPI00355B6723
MEAAGWSGARVEGHSGLCLGNDFYQMVEVASGWIVDFMCYCLCRYFGEGMYEEFRVMRDAMNGFVQQPSIIETDQAKKVHICQILSRIVEGKNLDVQFDQDESITPLESALLVLVEMADNQELKKDALYADLKQLLQIQEIKAQMDQDTQYSGIDGKVICYQSQAVVSGSMWKGGIGTILKMEWSVAVCIEKGDFKKASEVLERQFQENVASESDQPLKRKLSLVISKKDPCHKFLNNFSNKRLVDSAECLANRMLSEKKSNFLIQAATKVVQSKKKRDTNLDSSGDESNYEHQHGKCSEDLSREADQELNNTKPNKQRSKRQLYSFVEHKGWKPIKPEAVKDFVGKRKRSAVRKKKIASSGHLVETKKQNISVNSEVPRKKRPWLWEEDMQLKEGVRRFGSGNWTKILEHCEFKNRTSVMLKDRWRTMKKLCMINSDDDS